MIFRTLILIFADALFVRAFLDKREEATFRWLALFTAAACVVALWAMWREL
jgi:hypothetical protein